MRSGCKGQWSKGRRGGWFRHSSICPHFAIQAPELQHNTQRHNTPQHPTSREHAHTHKHKAHHASTSQHPKRPDRHHNSTASTKTSTTSTTAAKVEPKQHNRSVWWINIPLTHELVPFLPFSRDMNDPNQRKQVTQKTGPGRNTRYPSSLYRPGQPPPLPQGSNSAPPSGGVPHHHPIPLDPPPHPPLK